MNRLNALNQLKKHPINGKLFDRLPRESKEFIQNFVQENDNLSRNDYAHKVNRLFIDGEKPKNHVDIWAILSQC